MNRYSFLKGVAIFVAILLLILMTGEILISESDALIDQNPGDPSWFEKTEGKKLEDGLEYRYHTEKPKVAVISSDTKQGISFDIIDIVINDSNGLHSLFLDRKVWKIDTNENRSAVFYETDVKWAVEDRQDETGRLKLEFKVIWKGEDRRIVYLSDLKGNISEREVLLKWRYNIERGISNSTTPTQNLDKQTYLGTGLILEDRVTLNDSKGKEIANLIWDTEAEIQYNDEIKTTNVEVINEGEGDVTLFTTEVSIGKDAQSMRTGGELIFFIGFIEAVEKVIEKGISYYYDHIYSFTIGLAISLVIFISWGYSRVRAASKLKLKNELDFRNSLFYKGR